MIDEYIITNIEAFWNNRMAELVTENRFDDADALYLEYVVDGVEPEEWTCMDDMHGIH